MPAYIFLRGCSFAHIGSIYALSIGEHSQQVTVTGCVFSDLSGGAVKLGNVNDTRAVSKDPADWDQYYQLDHCVVESSSREYRGAAAMFIGYVAHTNIEQNTLNNTGYTGISLGITLLCLPSAHTLQPGWGWGRVVSFAQGKTR